MAFKTIERFVSFTQVKNFYLRVSARSQEPVSIHRVPANLSDDVVVGIQRVHALSTGSGVPNLYLTVFATCQNETLPRMPVAALYVRSMVGEAKLLLTG